jgi:hypothetical protein
MSRICSRHSKISSGLHFQNSRHNTSQILKWTLCIVTNSELEIEQCWICEVLLQPFWKWRPVEFFQCQESIRDIIIYLHMKCRWNRTCWFCAVLWWPFWKWRLLEIFELICSRHSKISSGLHFQNSRHNTSQIQHYPISTTFHMWVDYDVSNLFPTFKNF